jgi:hypothetical protein
MGPVQHCALAVFLREKGSERRIHRPDLKPKGEYGETQANQGHEATIHVKASETA